MPLFFLLSGFSCTLGYGRKKYSTLKQKTENPEDSPFKIWDFYFARISRILPVYYFCLFLHFLLVPLGYSYFEWSDLEQSVGGSLASLFCVQTWILFFGFGPNMPAWFVSTLMFFYMIYPRYIYLKRMFV
jgi:peptidoglycan/LPS O-acetylase OafA/YrhL